MFLDGTALFDLSQLLAYRRGEYDPSVALQAIEDDALKSMVLHMIQPAADMRLSAAEYALPATLSLILLQLGADGTADRCRTDCCRRQRGLRSPLSMCSC
jgi:hypothetical protein